MGTVARLDQVEDEAEQLVRNGVAFPLERLKLRWARESLRHAKTRANKEDVPFDLELEDIETPDYCPVFSTRLVYYGADKLHNRPSLDRAFPTLGYVRGNVSTISMRANWIKSSALPHEIDALHEYMVVLGIIIKE